MNQKDIFVTVITPVVPASPHVETGIRSILSVLRVNYNYYELVIVEDGASNLQYADFTSLLKEYEGIRVIRLTKSYGADIAVSVGLDSAIGDYVVVMDPLSDPSELIPDLVAHCRDNPGIHYGIDSLDKRSRGLVHNLGSYIFDWYCRKFIGVDVQRRSAIFRVFSRQAVNIFTQVKDRTRTMRLLTANLGVPVYKFDYQSKTTKGSTFHRTFSDDIDLALDILVATSKHPLRFLSRLGIMLAMVNLGYALYVIGVYFLKSHVTEGWVTLSMQNAVMFFFVFIVLAVTGEYIGNIVFETQKRPLYTVLDEKNSSVLVNENVRRNIVVDSANEDNF